MNLYLGGGGGGGGDGEGVGGRVVGGKKGKEKKKMSAGFLGICESLSARDCAPRCKFPT